MSPKRSNPSATLAQAFTTEIQTLTEKVGELEEEIKNIACTLGHQRRTIINTLSPWKAFGYRHLRFCDSKHLSEGLQTEKQTEIMDRIIFTRIRRFIGYSGVEVSLSSDQTIYATFHVQYFDSTFDHVKWDLNETLVLDDTPYKHRSGLQEKAKSANRLIPLVERQWWNKVGYRASIELKFNTRKRKLQPVTSYVEKKKAKVA
ncbi:hypothetical protein N7451_010927 [Penicillium sp. IBT 35674x]|nr:hypothetical protein N7451_010927 [Penicillium sp. IBT 35674x]